MLGGHAERLTEAQGVKLVDRVVLPGAVDLVGHEQDGDAAPPQKRRDLGVQRRCARSTVDDEEDECGLDQRGFGLQENLLPELDVVPT